MRAARSIRSSQAVGSGRELRGDKGSPGTVTTPWAAAARAWRDVLTAVGCDRSGCERFTRGRVTVGGGGRAARETFRRPRRGGDFLRKARTEGANAPEPRRARGAVRRTLRGLTHAAHTIRTIASVWNTRAIRRGVLDLQTTSIWQAILGSQACTPTVPFTALRFTYADVLKHAVAMLETHCTLGYGVSICNWLTQCHPGVGLRNLRVAMRCVRGTPVLSACDEATLRALSHAVRKNAGKEAGLRGSRRTRAVCVGAAKSSALV